VVGWG